MTKYQAKKTTIDGHVFDSGDEARRYAELRLMEKAGEISGLTLHPEFEVLPKQRRGKRTVSAIKYTADFQYIEAGKTVVEEFKGKEARDFSLRKRLFMWSHPDVLYRVTSAKKPTEEWQPCK